MLRFSLLLGLAACATTPDDIHGSQGRCEGLQSPSCSLTPGCQQAWVNSGFQPGPTPLRCLELEDEPSSIAPCANLDHDHCRARGDCAPVFWQQLGPADEPEGDPTYQRCELTTILTSS